MSKPSSRRKHLEQTKRKTWKETLRWIALPFVVILLAIVGVKYLFTQQVAAWFDDSWHYRTAHIISNSGSVINAERKIKIEIDTEALITAGKMQADCDDARFTTQTGEQLEYFIDTATDDCNTSSTDFYVKVPSVIAGDQTLFLYYGNPSAARGRSNDFFAPDTTGVGLVAYYPMDETTANTCAGGTNDTCDYASTNDSAWSGDTTYTVSGKVGGGTTYDGDTDFINLGNDSVLNTNDIFTITAWVNASAGGINRTIYTSENLGTATNGIQFRINSSNQLELLRTSIATVGTGTTAISTSTWTHVAITYNASGTYNFYVNGTTAGTGTNAQSFTYGTHLIGARRTTTDDEEFSGTLDDVRIYNRALTPTEITTIYNSGTGTTIPTPITFTPASTSAQSEEVGEAPIASWSFDEGTGTTAYDASSNANNGTISGATWQTEDKCISGKCLYFDGTDDYIQKTTPINTSSTTGTINAWAKVNTLPTDYGVITGTFENSADFDQVYIGVYNVSSSLRFVLVSRTGANTRIVGYTTKAFALNNWYYISGSVSSTGNTLYINGQQQTLTYLNGDSSTTGWTSGITNSYAMIGARQFNSTPEKYFHGFIDEVRIYPYARTPGQIKTDYIARGTQSGTTAQIGSGGAGSGQSLSNGLVAYYPMDEAAANTCSSGNDTCDASGNGNDGAWNGDATSGTGKYGSGVSFDGTDDSIQVPNNSILEPQLLTVSLWVKLNNTNKQHILLTKRHSAGTVPYNSYVLDVRNADKYYFCLGESSAQTCIQSTTGVSTNWVHLTGTYDGAAMYLYVNGIKEATSLGSRTIDYTNLDLYMGDYGSSWDASALLDEVRIYNRALTPAEVSALYHWAPGPVAHWKLDDSAGTSAIDSSGNGNTGALTNGPSWAQGKYGSAVSFDGVDDYISMNNSSVDTVLKPSLPLSGCAWIKPTNTSNYYTIFSNDDFASNSANYYGYILQISPSGALTTSFGDGGSAAPTGRRTKFSTETVQTNTWQHVCSVIRGSTDMNIYINGIDAGGTYDGSGDSLVYSMNDGHIAKGGNYFPGLIDDVQIYNYALTQEQIVKVMNGRSVNDPAVSSVSSSDDSGRPGQTVLHMSFDEGTGTTARDKSQYGNHGTLTNMASPATATSGWTNNGKVGKALAFDGTNDYTSVASPASLDDMSTFTISGWINTTSFSHQAVNYLIAKNNGTAGWAVGINGTHTICDSVDGALYLYINGASYCGSALTTGTWYYITLTFSSNKFNLYVNGNLDASGTTATPSSDAALNLNIGRRSDGNWYYNGMLDELKIHNYALSESEISQDYNAANTARFGSVSTESDGATYSQSSAREYCPPGDTSTCDAPVAEFKLDEGTGTAAQDTSGNANTGTLTNGPTWTQGKFGKALSFDGVNDYVSTADISMPSQDYSLSGWFKTNSLSTEQVILGKTSYEYSLAISTSGQLVYWHWNTVGQAPTFLDSSVIAGQWYFFEVTKNNTAANLYLNGQLVATDSSVNDTYRDRSETLKIGQGYANFTGGATKYFDGLIDQVRIYDYARTPAQIAWEYNRGAPVAWYKFDECQGTTINDWSENGNGDFNGNNGTLVVGGSGSNTSAGTCQGSSGQAWADGADGRYNSAMEFDGVDDYVEVADADSLTFGDGTTDRPFSLSTWVKIDTASGTQGIVSKATDAGVGEYYLTLGTSGANRFFFRLVDDSTGAYMGVLANKELSTDTWYHVVATYDGSGVYTGITVYVDGIAINTLDSSNGSYTAMENTATDLYIGRRHSSPKFSGEIDDVRIYNYALTEEQVREVYNGGAAVRFE